MREPTTWGTLKSGWEVVVVLVLCAVVAVVMAYAGIRLGREDAARRAAGDPSLFARRSSCAPSRPLLPEGHRPPPGLGPLSPSERFLTSESARGLRELQQFLFDDRRAA
jgi:hypothetical protein